MRYIGIIVPSLVIVAAALPVILSKRRLGFGLLFVALLGVLALGTISKVSDQFGYVLPWRDPLWLHQNGRNYTDPAPCSGRQLAGKLEPIGWVYGYFTPSRRLYGAATHRSGVARTGIWMQGRKPGCLTGYDLSGGP